MWEGLRCLPWWKLGGSLVEVCKWVVENVLFRSMKGLSEALLGL